MQAREQEKFWRIIGHGGAGQRFDLDYRGTARNVEYRLQELRAKHGGEFSAEEVQAGWRGQDDEGGAL